MNTTDAIDSLRRVPNTPVPGWCWREPVPGETHHEPLAAEICVCAGLTRDEGVLACVLASEFPSVYPAYLLAGAHAVINDATALYPDQTGDGHRTEGAILARVTRAVSHGGYFARQTGRWCSSWQAPTLRTLAAARAALAGTGAELARGARRWLDLKVQDGGLQAGARLTETDRVIRSRYADGWRWVGAVPGIDPYVLCLLARDGVPLAEALAALADGRARWRA